MDERIGEQPLRDERWVMDDFAGDYANVYIGIWWMLDDEGG